MRKRSLFALAALVPAGWAGACVRGLVLDPAGRPVAGAHLRLAAPSGSTIVETRSGQTGEFELPVEASGDFLLTAESAGFALTRRGVRLPPEDTLVVRLSLAAERTEITVTSSRGGVDQPYQASAMVDGAEIAGARTRPLPTAAHALEGSPGILLQQTAASQISPFLRGLTGYQVLNLIDGVRFNNSTFRSGPNQYLAFVEPSQAQRIESALGPSSSQYGSDSLGGTIQILTREARFSTAGCPAWHGDWNVYGASADASAGTDLHLAVACARLSWLAGLSGRKHNDLRAGGGADSRHVFRRFFGLDNGLTGRLSGSRQQDTGFTQTGLDTKLAARLSPSQILSLWYQRSSQGHARNYKDLWGGLGRLASALEPQVLDFAYARYEKFQLGWLDSVTGTFSANAQGDGSIRQNLRSSDSITTDRSQVNVYGLSWQATAHLGPSHAIAFGGERYDERIGSARTIQNPLTGARAGARPLYPDRSRYRTAALFAQDRFEIGRRLRATLGGRWSRVSYSNDADAFGTAASRRQFGDWTFSASLAWQATPSWSIHALAGRGFRAPNANDLGAIGLNDLGYEIPAADAVQAGALLGSSAAESATSLGLAIADLRAERLLNYELGLRFERRRFQGRVQAFDSELYDPIVRRTLLFAQDRLPVSLAGIAVTPLPPTAAQQSQGVVPVATPFDPRAVKAFVNDGRSRYYGVESSARALLGSHWGLDASYSFILGRDLNPNRNIRRLPPQQGSLGLRFARSRYWWQTSVVASGAQTRLSGGDLDDERIGASRSRSDIAAVFQGARLSPYVSGGVFTPTGETLRQIQDRLLPAVADNVRVPLYAKSAGWLVWNVRGGVALSETVHLSAGVLNLLDRNYRIHGSGVDSPGISAFLGVRLAW